MIDNIYGNQANDFIKELKALMVKHKVRNLMSGTDQGILIGLSRGEHNGDAFIMNYRLGNVFDLHAAEISELSNTFNEH
jgi:hypothetical protein